NSDSSTKEDADQQRKELEKAIEAVYVTMQRAGHRGKVESVLADSDTKAQTITGKDIVHKGNAVVNVKNAYISMNDKDTAPTAWGIDLVFDTSKVEAGDTTTISLSNLADFGASFKSGTEIVADDGKVIGKVTAVDWKTSTGNRGTDIPYFAQRQKNGMTYDERVAEQPAIANETGTVTYVIEWNELAKNYAVTTYSAANLTGSGYLAPAVSEDTPYKATIKVDGQTVVEHTYTHPATKPDTNKYGTMASLLTGNGMKYKGAERIGKNDSLNIQTDDDISYGKGSTFTVKLPSDEFTYFKKLNSGSDTVSDTDATYRPTNRWSNVKANENKVWILNDGRDGHFKLKVTLKSPTEIVAEVIEGEIEPGSTVAFDLAKVGIEKVVTDRTFADDYSKIVYNELGHVKDGSTIGNDKTAATLTVTGGKSVNGQPENVTTKVNNGWVVASSIADSSAAETGAVVLKLTDLETGKVIGYEPTEYNGEAKIKDDGTYETKNILGKKYDVTAQVPELVKKVNDTDYILVDLPPKGPTGTISISDKRVRDVYTAEEIKNLGLNPNAYLTNVIYSYVKKTKVEEVNRTIKFVYADDVKDL
ncbi:MAG: mucus-binding protein, partial [Staphylococcus aureus]|nr:mucus-binding protein [Staphylococcus aureus]